jgi:hypothetical protein
MGALSGFFGTQPKKGGVRAKPSNRVRGGLGIYRTYASRIELDTHRFCFLVEYLCNICKILETLFGLLLVSSLLSPMGALFVISGRNQKRGEEGLRPSRVCLIVPRSIHRFP